MNRRKPSFRSTCQLAVDKFPGALFAVIERAVKGDKVDPLRNARHRCDGVINGVFVLFVHFLAVFTKKRFQINHLKIRQVAKSSDGSSSWHGAQEFLQAIEY